MKENSKKELNKESEITKEDKLLAFLGGKFIIYILLIVILYRNFLYFHANKCYSIKYYDAYYCSVYILLYFKSVGKFLFKKDASIFSEFISHCSWSYRYFSRYNRYGSNSSGTNKKFNNFIT